METSRAEGSTERPPKGVGREKRDEPQAGSGVQQTRSTDAEETVEVVENGEGGT